MKARLFCLMHYLSMVYVGKLESLLLPLATPEGLWQTLSLDFIMELHPSEEFTPILVVVVVVVVPFHPNGIF